MITTILLISSCFGGVNVCCSVYFLFFFLVVVLLYPRISGKNKLFGRDGGILPVLASFDR